MNAHTKPRVTFTADNEHANRIAAVLEALGYDAVREPSSLAPADRQRVCADRMAKLYSLTCREEEVLGCVLQGFTFDQIAAAIEISRATVKWHMHNLLCKTGARDQRELLHKALFAEPSPTDKEPIP